MHDHNLIAVTNAGFYQVACHANHCRPQSTVQHILRTVALISAVGLRPRCTLKQPPQLFSGMEVYVSPGWHTGANLGLWLGCRWIHYCLHQLTYTEGESVQLNFTNPSPESHHHLHGLDVDQANDGVPGTSFLVTTGDDATYSFDADYPGTFLYHCHVTTTLHLTMGMYGMVLVTRPDLPYLKADLPTLRMFPCCSAIWKLPPT